MKSKGMTAADRVKAEIKATMRAIRESSRPENPQALIEAERRRERRKVRNLRQDHNSRMGQLPPLEEDEDELIRLALQKQLDGGV